MLKVQETNVCGPGNKSGFGITDGKKWFFYAYPTREQAEAVLAHFTTKEHTHVNISYPQPHLLVKGGEVRGFIQ